MIRDLVPDMTNFLEQYNKIDPFMKRSSDGNLTGTRQLLQSERDRKKLDGLYECILCGCCSFSCPPYWWASEKYLGPAVLLQVHKKLWKKSKIKISECVFYSKNNLFLIKLTTKIVKVKVGDYKIFYKSKKNHFDRTIIFRASAVECLTSIIENWLT